MEVKTAIIKRRSIRSYKDKDVSEATINNILEVARFTPSSGNIQNWQVVVIRNEQKKQQIAEACLKQTWMNQAPVFLVICNNLKNIEELYKERGRNLYSIQNCAAFIQNILTLATSHNLASCWVSAFDDNAISRVLRLPDYVRPEAVITLGYSDEKPKPPIRLNCQDITFYGCWGQRREPKQPGTIKKILRKFKK